jgi:CBS domain-containing protein
MKLQDLMSTDVVTVRPDTPIKTVARTLAAHRVSGVPVVTKGGEVVGVISESDLIVREALPASARRSRIFRRGSRPGDSGHRVASDAMTTPAVVLQPYRSVQSAAQAMLDHDIHRIPIVRRGQLVGIVTAGDLVRAFARPDDVIAADVRDEVRHRLDLIGDRGRVRVDTDTDGIHLRGTIMRRSTARDLVEVAGAVPGVLDVHSELAWLEDDSRGSRRRVW